VRDRVREPAIVENVFRVTVGVIEREVPERVGAQSKD
jgi:hypothetical protein